MSNAEENEQHIDSEQAISNAPSPVMQLTEEEKAILRQKSQNAMALFKNMLKNKNNIAEAPKPKGQD